MNLEINFCSKFLALKSNIASLFISIYQTFLVNESINQCLGFTLLKWLKIFTLWALWQQVGLLEVQKVLIKGLQKVLTEDIHSKVERSQILKKAKIQNLWWVSSKLRQRTTFERLLEKLEVKFRQLQTLHGITAFETLSSMNCLVLKSLI